MVKKSKLSIADCAGRSTCPLANTLDLLGDKWTLIIIRDMLFLGKKQYGDFLQSPEGISTNILADRLKRLEEYRIVYKEPYKTNPERHEYFLTETGYALQPVILSIAAWGMAHIEGTRGPTEEMLMEMLKAIQERRARVGLEGK